jgi:hypothetical protein
LLALDMIVKLVLRQNDVDDDDDDDNDGGLGDDDDDDDDDDVGLGDEEGQALLLSLDTIVSNRRDATLRAFRDLIYAEERR